MKAILISIRPQWVEKILNGIKKDEVRKGTAIGKAINRLIKEQGVAPMLIYCTKDKKVNFLTKQIPIIMQGKVVARFNATEEHIEYETCSRDISGWWKDDGKIYDHKDACLTYKEMFDYVGAGEGTVIHINDLEIFDKPKEISEFRHSHCDNLKNVNVVRNLIYDDYVFQFYDNERCKNCKSYDSDVNDCLKSYKPLTRAPQSWCYIEV